MQIFFIIIASIVCLAVMPFFLSEQRHMSYRSLTLKMVCASMFVIVGALAINKIGMNEYAKYMFAGLVCSWFGDLFLHIPGKAKNICAVFGVIGFLAAHIMYLTAYNGKLKSINPANKLLSGTEVLIILILIVIYVIIFLAFKTPMSPVHIPLLLYMFCLLAMCIKAISLGAIIRGSNTVGAVFLSLGGIMFVLSDTTLGLLMFNKKLKTNFRLKIFNIATYFVGQLLLAATILFIA